MKNRGQNYSPVVKCMISFLQALSFEVVEKCMYLKKKMLKMFCGSWDLEPVYPKHGLSLVSFHIILVSLTLFFGSHKAKNNISVIWVLFSAASYSGFIWSCFQMPCVRCKE